MATVFVYYKNDEIRVLDAEEAGTQHNQLIKENWKHTAALDVCRWIEYLFNKSEDDDIVHQIRELKN
jgi:hypothetical protein